MKIEYRLPAKNVQYGYVNVEGTPEELASLDYVGIGMRYITSVQNFWIGEIEQVDRAIALDELTKAGQEIEATPEKINTYVPDESDQAESLIVKELGGVKISEEVYDEPVEEQPKPWAAPAVFDFDN